jgi:hypothetical protein
MIDAVFTNEIPMDFGNTMMDEMQSVAAVHNYESFTIMLKSLMGAYLPRLCLGCSD